MMWDEMVNTWSYQPPICQPYTPSVPIYTWIDKVRRSFTGEISSCKENVRRKYHTLICRQIIVIIVIFVAIIIVWTTRLGFLYYSIVLDLEMCNSLDGSTPGHSP